VNLRARTQNPLKFIEAVLRVGPGADLAAELGHVVADYLPQLLPFVGVDSTDVLIISHLSIVHGMRAGT
jgi:hypothetical protein